jgi:hypothetical protein
MTGGANNVLEEKRMKTGASRSLVKRCLAVVTMVGIYCLSALAISGFMLNFTVTPAEAGRGGGGGGRGGGGGGGRGGGGRGVGRGGGRGVVRGGRGVRGVRGGRGRGYYRGGVWFPWIAPGFCRDPYTGFRVPCPLY